MTLNGRTTLYCTNDASFGAQHGNLKEDRPILSAAKCSQGTLLSGSVHMDTHGGSVAGGLQTSVGWSQLVIFGNFSRHIFRTIRVKANIIMCSGVMMCLSSGPKMLELE